jgi:hypothetical protein
MRRWRFTGSDPAAKAARDNRFMSRARLLRDMPEQLEQQDDKETPHACVL